MCYIFTSHSNLLVCIVVDVLKLHGVRQAFPSLTNQTKDYFYKVWWQASSNPPYQEAGSGDLEARKWLLTVNKKLA